MSSFSLVERCLPERSLSLPAAAAFEDAVRSVGRGRGWREKVAAKRERERPSEKKEEKEARTGLGRSATARERGHSDTAAGAAA